MKSPIQILSCLSLFALALPGALHAEDKPAAPAAATPAAKPAKTKVVYTPLYAQVASITDTELTVKGTGPDTKFVINAETKITSDKAHKVAAKASDAKVGQWIGGSYTKAADGSNVLHSLHLGVSQKGELSGKPKQ